MKNVYLVVFTENIFEGNVGYISVHKTHEGALIALDKHRKEYLDKVDEDEIELGYLDWRVITKLLLE